MIGKEEFSLQQAKGSLREFFENTDFVFKSEHWLDTVLKDMWDTRGKENGSINVEDKEELGNYQSISILSTSREMLKQQVEQTILNTLKIWNSLAYVG